MSSPRTTGTRLGNIYKHSTHCRSSLTNEEKELLLMSKSQLLVYGACGCNRVSSDQTLQAEKESILKEMTRCFMMGINQKVTGLALGLVSQ